MEYFKKYRMFIFYYILGIINALALSAYPLIYIDKGFSPQVVTSLISLSFLAMILQPLIGMFTDKIGDSIKSLKYIIIVYIVSSILMFFSIKLFVIGLILNSITRNSLVPIIDGYVTQNADNFEYSYAKMRTAMPIGFGTAFIISLVFISVFKLPISGMLIFLGLIAAVGYIIVNSLTDIKVHSASTNTRLVVEKSNFLFIGLLMAYYLLYAGLYQISSSYLSLYITEIHRTELFIGIMNLLMVVPQIFLMFNYDRLLGRLKNTTVMFIATAFGIVQALIYITFSGSIVMLILASMFSGVQIVLFPAAFFPEFTRAIKSSKLSTVLTLNTSIQAIWVGLYNQILISSVYGMTGTTFSVYWIVIITMAISILPVLVYRTKINS